MSPANRVPADRDPIPRPDLPEGSADPHILDNLRGLLSEGRSVVLATVIATTRSVPRHTGAKMLIVDDGRQIGSIGGGEMESRVLEEAAGCLADRNPRILDYQLLDPNAGDPGVCGGEVTIYLEPHMPPPTLLVIGCGHVGRAVVNLASWLGFHVVANDDRIDVARELADGLPSHSGVQVLPGTLAEVLGGLRLTDNDYGVVVTRNVEVDIQNLPHLLATDVGRVGVMGSRRRWDTTKNSLLDAGVSEADLERVTSPIGIDIGAETPEEIAVSILAQVVDHRRVS
ncbi:MAG: XdhC family protein [Actinomycetota bacterium]|nr:XdhC family protein [Actinomycetota bacterium]